ncbi:DUF4450 domain-containing protein [Opitutus terrae]|uniref:DUF4450 domain-containing protein n=1 Tax=Opitutus terrae (strain DSM 11246 / JCM 15787 / PB90-1) TaxID=452637 RepID=B1ZP56_OPITP|nr:DUF4450 domain-containing protein [Opitutus terrae]ACB77542.1 hypothetical protein Oter_4269 [Opitutus terrae PB90-1]
MLRLTAAFLALVALASELGAAESLRASRFTPNLVDNLDRPLRYQPDGADFLIENGTEFFNRALYGGNTAFRVDGGDKPEFVLYLPGRGGNLRFALHTSAGAKWLHDATHIATRYRPGQLIYEIRDPLLGEDRVLTLSVLAYADAEGCIVRAELAGSDRDAPSAPLELLWAYGGVNGQRGKRDGDIGTEAVPISEWFQLRPEFCRGNVITLAATGFTLRAKPATIVGDAPAGSHLALGDAANWNDLPALITAGWGRDALVASFDQNATRTSRPHKGTEGGPTFSLVIGRCALETGRPLFLSLECNVAGARADDDLDTYRAVTALRGDSRPPTEDMGGTPMPRGTGVPPVGLAAGSAVGRGQQVPPRDDAADEDASVSICSTDLARRWRETERHFRELRQRVRIDTPDPFLNAAVGALNVAADAAWDAPQQAIMHGAIAWRTKLLGWRGPYALDALGWHERFQRNFTYWAGRQNVDPIPASLPPADENANLARNEAGLHSNGDLSNSHYDMNLVAIDALFRHLHWTGDLAFAEKMWPVIERHLAWERRLFRREFGPDRLPLYEAYAAIWASDDLQYHGGGVTHASAYNYYHNTQAARLARLLGRDPQPYEREADLIARAMRTHLWLPEEGAFAEFKDLLGLQRVHPSAAVWTFYHTMDAGLPTPQEAWQMTRRIDAQIPHLPVRGPGVPSGLHVVSTTNWMPYTWSINNVVLPEVVHTALGFWQAGRREEAWTLTKGALLASMFMGIAPGNVGSMSYLDVYRRESQRDFVDSSGVLSRALVEGLFGLKPDLLAGELRVEPGFPADWNHAAINHPDVALRFERSGDTDHYVITQHFAKPQSLRLVLAAPRDRVGSFAVNGDSASWQVIEDAVGAPRIVITSPAGFRHEVLIQWAGQPIAQTGDAVARVGDLGLPGSPSPATSIHFTHVTRGQMRWWQPVDNPARPVAEAGHPDGCKLSDIPAGARFDCVDLTPHFNDRVTQIFRNVYRSPRSPAVSLAIPKQGLGGWAGGVNATAEIDDSGLRQVAGQNGSRLLLPNGVPLATPFAAAANNIVFTSQWDNYPHEATIPLSGRAQSVTLLLAGSTNHMQSRIDNGEIVVGYSDGTTTRLALENPTNWWPIEQDYFLDDFQFQRPGPLPVRVDLKTGAVRLLELPAFKGRGGRFPGGAATVLELPLDPTRELRSLTVRALANEVVVGLMAATLVR